jgi:hypothetical protein
LTGEFSISKWQSATDFRRWLDLRALIFRKIMDLKSHRNTDNICLLAKKIHPGVFELGNWMRRSSWSLNFLWTALKKSRVRNFFWEQVLNSFWILSQIFQWSIVTTTISSGWGWSKSESPRRQFSLLGTINGSKELVACYSRIVITDSSVLRAPCISTRSNNFLVSRLRMPFSGTSIYPGLMNLFVLMMVTSALLANTSSHLPRQLFTDCVVARHPTCLFMHLPWRF